MRKHSINGGDIGLPSSDEGCPGVTDLGSGVVPQNSEF